MKKLTLIFLSIFCLFISTTGASHAVVIRHDKPDSDYLALAANFPAVGAIVIEAGDGECSGTLVAADMVLTAAHCIDNDGDGIADEPDLILDATFQLGADLNSPTHTREIEMFYLNPQWHQSGVLNRKDGNDIALIKLAAPINDVVPLKISIQDPVGYIGTTVGYGATADGNATSTGEGDGKKRAGQNLIEYKSPLGEGDDDIGGLHGDFDHPDGSTNTMGEFMLDAFDITHTSSSEALALEGFGWGGDSGGPVTVDFQDGHGSVIVGIASASFNPLDEDAPCGYGAIDIWASFTNPGNRAFLESHGLQLLGAPMMFVYLPLVANDSP